MDLRSAFLSLVKEEDLMGLEERIALHENYTISPSYSNKSWAEWIFEHMPVAAIYTLLRKFQNDINNTAAEILAYLEKKINGKT